MKAGRLFESRAAILESIILTALCQLSKWDGSHGCPVSASALFEFAYKNILYISLTFISVAGRRSQLSGYAENLHNLDKYQRHCCYWPVHPAMIIAFVRFS